ncbi:hypothetical protein CPB84DRAFT_1780453 [Gymnopilus junonius]|uniref:Uncharacterized protein n=1 Tax=Gymnopilus junonius TaxID=109634 RepID=A0A9P5NPG4_GYMJU|nr:hypothetical protein CPB84DRAFT_1780453 [Gymnopilus junonius]
MILATLSRFHLSLHAFHLPSPHFPPHDLKHSPPPFLLECGNYIRRVACAATR